MRIFVLLIVLFNSLSAFAAPVMWGGKHISLTQDGKKITFTLDCAHGSGADFTVKKKKISGTGKLVRETGGPTRPDEPAIEPVPVSFSGTVNGNEMKLTIRPSTVGGAPLKFTLKKGAAAELNRCL